MSVPVSALASVGPARHVGRLPDPGRGDAHLAHGLLDWVTPPGYAATSMAARGPATSVHETRGGRGLPPDERRRFGRPKVRGTPSANTRRTAARARFRGNQPGGPGVGVVNGTSSAEHVVGVMRLSSAILLLTVICSACAPATPDGSGATGTETHGGTTALTPSASDIARGGRASGEAPLTLADAESCPVTTAGRAPDDIGDRLFGTDSAFGSDELWVGGLGDRGVILADSRSIESDGSIGWKFGWWRIVPGTLTITGRRLDAPGPPLRGSAPDGYGSTGFQASGVSFPTEGCWEVTGSVGGSELTFVTFVIRT